MRRLDVPAILFCVALLPCGTTRPADEPPPNTLTQEEKDAGWRLLFDGKTTKGWRGYKKDAMPKGWEVIEGVLVRVSGGEGGKGAGGGDDIITEQQFDNFELKLQWRIVKGGNSGILYRVTEDAETSWHVACEMQVLDNSIWQNRNKKQLAGALYDLYACTKDMTRELSKWNDVHLVAKGNKIEHWLNGEKVVSFEIGSDDWKQRIGDSKFKDKPNFAKAAKGHICLQDHSDKVEYRSIKIKVLKEK